MTTEKNLDSTDSIRANLSGVAATEPALALYDENLQRPASRKAVLDFILAQTQLNNQVAAAMVALAGSNQRDKVAKLGDVLKLTRAVNDLGMATFNQLSQIDGSE